MLQELLSSTRELQDLKVRDEVLRSLRLAYVASWETTGAIDYQQQQMSGTGTIGRRHDDFAGVVKW